MPQRNGVRFNQLILDQISSTSAWGLMALLCIGYFLTLLCSYEFIYTEELLWSRYQNLGSDKVILDLIDAQNDNRWIYYLGQQVLIWSKLIVLTFALYLCSFIFKVNVSIKTILGHVTLAEFTILFYELLRMIWLTFFYDFSTFEEALTFAPLSVAQTFNYPSEPLWLWHLLSSIHLFELLYIVVLSYLYRASFDRSIKFSFKVTFLAYGCSFLIWTTFVSILLINAEISN